MLEIQKPGRTRLKLGALPILHP